MSRCWYCFRDSSKNLGTAVAFFCAEEGKRLPSDKAIRAFSTVRLRTVSKTLHAKPSLLRRLLTPHFAGLEVLGGMKGELDLNQNRLPFHHFPALFSDRPLGSARVPGRSRRTRTTKNLCTRGFVHLRQCPVQIHPKNWTGGRFFVTAHALLPKVRQMVRACLFCFSRHRNRQ